MSRPLAGRSSAPYYTIPPALRTSRGSHGHPILPTTQGRQLSIRLHGNGATSLPFDFLSNAGRFRRNRRLGVIVVLALTVAFIFWKGRQSTLFDKLSLEERCKVHPWLAECVGQTLAGTHDPYEDLHYEREYGHLFYPAHSAVENSSMLVPDDQPHPIHLLMDEAARAWEKKVSRQSKTLREAVEEYERRYKMRPPKGFDRWFEFAQSNNFVLVDEFDSLHRNILPFLALPSSLHQKRAQKLQFDTDFWLQDKTFTIQIMPDGSSQAHGPMSGSPNDRAQQMLDLLEGFQDRLPEMNITFTGHDVPWIGLSGTARQEMVAKARAGEFMEEEKWDDYQDNWDLDGWAVICPPGSPIRSAKRFDERAEHYLQPPRSFIHDHVASMDLCTHPERQTIHGFTAWPGPRPGLLYPIFTFTTSTMHADLLAPPIDQWDRPLGDDPDWDDKMIDKVVWRGSTTGADLNIAHMRKWSQRPRLVQLMKKTGLTTLPIAPYDKPNQLGRMENFTSPTHLLSFKYFDFKFLGRPEQCNDPEACAEFVRDHLWDAWMDQEDQNLYKYVIDVDGNGWSGRFKRLMSTSVMVLKSTIFPEWYADHIQPWLHYVPVATDYSDLWAIMAFFKGDRDGRGEHDELAKKIGLEGQKWSANHWRWVDMQIYFYRLLLEYDRFMRRDDHDPHSMDF